MKTLPSVLVALLWLLPAVLFAQAMGEEPSAEAILQKVRDKYSQLKSYHFEHTMVVRESDTDKAEDDKAPGEEIARVELSTASEQHPDEVDTWNELVSNGQLPFGLKRMRMQAKGKDHSFLLASDGTTRWVYHGDTKEYIARDDRPVYGPTASTMFVGLHLLPFARYVGGKLQAPKRLAAEELKIGDDVKACFVVEGSIKPDAAPLPPGIEPREAGPKTNPLQRVTGTLFFLQIHGHAHADAFYAPSDEIEPTLKLWIDQKSFVVWQSHLQEKVRKQSAADKPSQDVVLTVIHHCSLADIGTKLPDSAFRFEPPKDAKRVEKLNDPMPK